MRRLNTIHVKLSAVCLAVMILQDQFRFTTNEPSNPYLEHNNRLVEQGLRLPQRTSKRQSSALTGHEWTQQLRCKQDQNQTLSSSSFRLTPSSLWFHLMSDCHREELAWRFKYIDELKPSFTLQVKDKTIDERLINIIYSISLSNLFSTNYFVFNSGNPSEDVENERRVAGLKVDDSRCHQELSIMSNLYDDMQYQLAQFRTADENLRTNLSLAERHIRLARVMDSFGRYESGSLDGKVQLAGSYEECIGSQLTTNNEEEHEEDTRIQMRYCWANMNSKKHLHPLLKGRKKFDHEPDYPVLNVAACLPQSCHSKSFHRQATRAIVERLINSQMRLPNSIYVDELLELESIFCLVDVDSEQGRIPTSGKLCLLVVGLWSMLCICVTVVNKFLTTNAEQNSQEKSPTQSDMRPKLPFHARLRQCLDLSQSWNDLTSDQRQLDSSAAVNLDTLNPIKLVACAFCVAAHTALMLGSVALNPVKNAAYVDTTVLLMAALMTSVVVDTFFVISGVLLTYITLKKLSRRARRRTIVLWCESSSNQMSLTPQSKVKTVQDKNDSKESLAKETRTFFGQWFFVALNRYLRLVPLYAIMFWFRRDVLTYLGEGPFWDHGLNRDTPSGACVQEPWYMPFTYLSAYRQLSKQCYVTSWSISNDIFFGLFCPPIIILFLSRPKVAIGSIVALITFSLVAATNAVVTLPMADVWQYLDANMLGISLLMRSLTPLYSWPIYRICSFLVGVLAGYFLYEFDQRHSYLRQKMASDNNNNGGNHTFPRRARWPKWLTGPATLFSFIYLIFHLILSIFANDLKPIFHPYHRLFAFYFLNGDRLVWSITNAILFLQMMTTWRHSSWMQSFASQTWRSMARLNFSVIFIHWILVVVYMGLMPQAPVFTLWQIFAAFSVILISSIGIGAVVHVVIENPIDKLIKREIFGF